ncbi:hypothetical protein APHAL10511_001954 [Amanita phalloides]|nr:hypothetical protein APHAL10511_001954 [Amanita phalloides]
MPLAYPAPPSLHASIALLDSLLNFYREEQMWVDRTRADLVTHMGNMPPIDISSEQSGRESYERSKSRWAHRKNEFKLRLEDLSGKDIRRSVMLDLFEELLEVRLESCERVNELVQQAVTTRDSDS